MGGQGLKNMSLGANNVKKRQKKQKKDFTNPILNVYQYVWGDTRVSN